MLSVMLVIASTFTTDQVLKSQRKKLTDAKPECAKGAICFSGEVHEGGEFRRHLTTTLDFIVNLPGEIDVVSTNGNDHCKLSASVANPPLRAHHDTEIDLHTIGRQSRKYKHLLANFVFPQTAPTSNDW
jgi:hypothetical protein